MSGSWQAEAIRLSNLVDIQNEDEPGRCSDCRKNEDAAYWAAINEMRDRA